MVLYKDYYFFSGAYFQFGRIENFALKAGIHGNFLQHALRVAPGFRAAVDDCNHGILRLFSYECVQSAAPAEGAHRLFFNHRCYFAALPLIMSSAQAA